MSRRINHYIAQRKKETSLFYYGIPFSLKFHFDIVPFSILAWSAEEALLKRPSWASEWQIYNCWIYSSYVIGKKLDGISFPFAIFLVSFRVDQNICYSVVNVIYETKLEIKRKTERERERGVILCLASKIIFWKIWHCFILLWFESIVFLLAFLI